MRVMKTFVTLLMCFGIFQNISAQVVNYEIDSSFNTGDFYTKGNVFNLFITENENIIVCGGFSVSSTIAGGWSIIENDGSFIYNSTTQDIGPATVEPYLTKYITSGPSMYLRNEDATADYSFRFEFQKPAYGGFISSAVNDILVKDDSLLIVGGIFFTDSTDISPNSLRQLCMIDSTGAPIPGFPMVKCEPFDARIHSIDSLSTGEYIIAGSFSSVNGHLTNNVAKLHADFSVDTSFVNIFGNQGTAVVGEIDSLDRIWVRIGNGILSSNPDSSVYLLRLLPSGELDTSIQIPTFISYYDSSNPFETGPAAIALLEDNTILLGGNFVEVNGEYHKTMVQLYADGSIVEGAFENLGADEAVWDNWEPALGPIAGTYIRIIKRLPDGKLLLGGSFSSFGGEPRNCLVRLQPCGFVGLDEKEGRGKLEIYPNPAKEFITIQLPVNNQRLSQVKLYDLNGRLVQEVKLIDPSGKIDLKNLPQGMYLVKAISEKQVYIGKVLIE